MEPEILGNLKTRDVQVPFAAARPGLGDAILSVISGERASQGPGNKICACAGKTHIVWQDSYSQRYFARVRTLDRATGKWTPGAVLSEGVDEHSRPALSGLPQVREFRRVGWLWEVSSEGWLRREASRFWSAKERRARPQSPEAQLPDGGVPAL